MDTSFVSADKFVEEFKQYLDENSEHNIEIRKLERILDPTSLEVYEVSANKIHIYTVRLTKKYSIRISNRIPILSNPDEIFEIYAMDYNEETFKNIKTFFHEIHRRKLIKHIMKSNRKQSLLEDHLLLLS
jgi:hypothetical protein